jgi:ribosomal-protein-alanine N-acetyltransferase
MVRKSRPGSKIVYTENNSGQSAIKAHFEKCNGRFLPPLDTRVDIGAYSSKLFEKSHRIEAWCEDVLVGLLAFYVDENSDKMVFITNVSVDQSVRGTGLGSNLMMRCIAFADSEDIRYLTLQTDGRNPSALGLYERHGFKRTNKEAKDHLYINMILDLRETGVITDRL